MDLRIYLALLISLTSSCASMNFKNMLDETADYDGKVHTEESLSAVSGPMFGPKRVEAKLTDVYIHPHEMSNGDFFLGGWVKTVVSHAYWEGPKPTFNKPKKKKR